ncbi:glycine/betaine ABC transporter ATP-binding protein [Sporanaerobium hydrogeniformans]|uniref:Glycine/betaine ABC transporter ATP-binding protein n=1 Tax=Sporanaerobium hydrogeniformans TaxID=3072179 RepID=A0AC61D9D6_9FIRM|nr:ABC transporter ATP-binding protein [Sporanaerobium hydrogeniformans]PHV69901.1 glycine/betaine ABC transporter ATP-binding protein [Sporanaerobium hydrogeniformans]
MIEFNQVSKSYGQTQIIKDLTFKLEEGKLYVFIGPSGCGKTTTLKMINRLIEPNGGNIKINGEDISHLNAVQLRRNIGYVIQQIGLFPNMTVEENICVVPRMLKWSKEKCHERVKELLELVHMKYERYAKKYPTQLSGGQQQRIGVLRALAAQPPIVLMDEPFGALDPLAREVLQDEVKSLQKKLHKTIIFVTHDMEEALKMADVIVFMEKGRIIQMASPQEMLTNPASDTIREFMGKHVKNTHFLKVSDFMDEQVVKVSHSRPVIEATEVMKRKKVDSLIVTDQRNTFKGVITIEDLKKGTKGTLTIGELLNKEVRVVKKDMDAKEAFNLLIKSENDYLVVVGNNKEVVGIIDKTNMVETMAEALWGDLA